MSAALKSYVPRPLPPRRRSAPAPATQRSSTAALPVEQQPQVSPPVALPTAPGLESSSPVVQALSQLQLVSSALAVSLVALTLVSYGTSVYISRQLSQANQQLSRLQRSEQQLTTANEVLKNHLAQQVGMKELGFQPPQPGSVIFLKPAQRPAPALEDRPAGGIALPGPLGDRFTLPKVEVPLGY